MLKKLLRHPLVQMMVVTLCGAAAYSNTFDVPFVLDDFHVIAENSRIDRLGTLLVSDLFPGPRWFALATFALNKELGGVAVTGYHAVNLVIHLAVALVIYRLAMTTISGFSDEAAQRYRFAPFLASLGFVLHPLHTESVTYIVQRMTSLATLLYLVAVLLYATAYGSDSGQEGSARVSRRFFSAAAVICALLAMSSKEISFTLPIILMLYDICFLKATARERFLRLVPHFLCMVVLFFFIVGTERVADALAHGGGDAAGRSLPHAAYLVTELSVLVTYLRLLVMPAGQNLDYDFPVLTSLIHPRAAASFGLLVILSSCGLFLLLRSFRVRGGHRVVQRATGFAVIWFFITISIESGIVPLIDTAFEHRVYLPSVWFFIAFGMVVCDVCRWLPSFIPIIAICVFGLMAGAGYATYQRNNVWGDAITLWTDVTTKSPGKARGWTYLGIAHLNRSVPYRAILPLERAIRLNPDYYLAHAWLGRALAQVGDTDRALSQYVATTRIAPNFSKGWELAGRLLLEKNRAKEAALFLGRAREIDPSGFASQWELQQALNPAAPRAPGGSGR